MQQWTSAFMVQHLGGPCYPGPCGKAMQGWRLVEAMSTDWKDGACRMTRMCRQDATSKLLLPDTM